MGERRSDATCPRCGYDQRGTISTWRESCPVRGTCSECGLEFDWVDVVRPERVSPRWSFEHAPAERLARTFVRTWALALRPAFWRWMPLAAPIRLGRVLVLAALLLGALHGLAVAAAVQLNWDQLWVGRFAPAGPAPFVNWTLVEICVVQPYVYVDGSPLINSVPATTLLLIMWGALIPLPYLALVETMSKAKVKAVHLVRGAVCFLPWLVMVMVLGVVWTVWGQNMVHYQWWWVGLPLSLAGFAVLAWRWWLAFTRTYLRLDHAHRVTGTMVLIGFLGAMCVALRVSPELMPRFGQLLP